MKLSGRLATRIVLLVALLIVLGLGINLFASNSLKVGSGKKPYAGTTLRVAFAHHVWTDTVIKLLPEFEHTTGIKVEVEDYFEDQLTKKLTVDLTSGSSAVDLFMFRPLQNGKLFAENNWLNPLNSFVIKDSAWDLGDFENSAVGSVTIDNLLWGVPIVTEREVLYYRKDILVKNHLSVPKTLDELVADAKKLNNPSKGIYGFVARGNRSASVSQFSSFLYSYGGDFEKAGKATINTPQAIQAYQTYGSLLRNYGPPGSLNMSWPEAVNVFSQGNAVFYTDADSIFSKVTDPQRSKVTGKVSWAPFPAGPQGSKPYEITSWGLGISKYSQNKNVAWEFIKWVTSKEIMLKIQQKGVPGARESVWNSPSGLSGFPADLVKVMEQSKRSSVDHDRPVVIDIEPARNAVGVPIVAAIQGEDVKAAADKANADLQAILDEEKNN